MHEKLLWAIASTENHPTNARLNEMMSNWEDYDKNLINLKSDHARHIIDDFNIAKELGVKVVTFIDKEYPNELRKIANPPAFFYLRGNIEALSREVNVTIVGSRECTPYGENVATEFSRSLAEYGIGIVSGGAVGIDASAHRGALQSNGYTIAVLGCGIDVDYPKQNSVLFDKIVKKGAIISEFPMGMEPLGKNFPRRNRIMTALGSATIVVEAGERSGALISANYAEDQGKTLFAVPGNITSPSSAGVNRLIRDGANVALSYEDILDELILKNPDFFSKKEHNDNITVKEEKNTKEIQNINGLSPLENKIVQLIKEGKKTAAEIEECCNSDANITAVLSMLELKGVIKLGFGKHYKLK